MKRVTLLLSVQTFYYLTTAIWPLVDIDGFMQVTGPKTDIWLVKTEAVLLLAISVSFIFNLFIHSTDHRASITLATTCCIVLAAIDFYYAGRHVISPVYFADGIIQLLLLAGWVMVILKYPKKTTV